MPLNGRVLHMILDTCTSKTSRSVFVRKLLPCSPQVSQSAASAVSLVPFCSPRFSHPAMDPGLQSDSIFKTFVMLSAVGHLSTVPHISTRTGAWRRQSHMRAATITVCSIRLSLRIWQSVGKYTRHTLPPLVWSLLEKMLPPWPHQTPLLLPCWESFLRSQNTPQPPCFEPPSTAPCVGRR